MASALRRAPDHFPALFGALVLATGIDLWQHAIHANAHILTALLATCTLYLLLRWWRTDSRLSLYVAAFIAGLSPVQHPLLVFAFPAYVLFVVVVVVVDRRAQLANGVHRADRGHRADGEHRAEYRRYLGRILLTSAGAGLLGLSAYLYYPIRSRIGAPPMPGPSDMHTWVGFLRVVTAQGLRGNLLGFSFREVLQRLWDVRVPLRLHYTVPGLIVAALGFVHLWRRLWQCALLLTAYLACVLFVTVNILQDEMAYLLGPMVVVGGLVGVGIDMVVRFLLWSTQLRSARLLPARLLPAAVVGIAMLSMVLPVWSLAVNWERMDLSDFRDADAWLQEVESRFAGQGQHVALLTEWERMTTVYYYSAVEGRTWDEKDLRFVPISSGTEAPFLKASEENMSRGPVYLTSYRPEVASRYRLMPSGGLWQVLPAWPRELPAGGVQPTHIAAADIEIVGWSLNQKRVQPGDLLLLDLYMRSPGRLTHGESSASRPPYYLPWVRLGHTTYHFTTDSRFNSPWWERGEIVVERFELPVSWYTPAGRVPLEVGLRLVSEGRNLELEGGQELATLAEVEIEPAEWRPPEQKLNHALGNLRGDILLRSARVDGRAVRTLDDPGSPPLRLRPGTSLRVVLKWESLQPIDENYKVFVQLLDGNLQVRAQGDDKAPLGGSAPTLLWFPRWRRGTRITDTYLLDVPSDLSPGSYPLVVGMYGFTTFRRVQVVSPEGDMEGDWITVGHLQVE
jgi:hypothetical protein